MAKTPKTTETAGSSDLAVSDSAQDGTTETGQDGAGQGQSGTDTDGAGTGSDGAGDAGAGQGTGSGDTGDQGGTTGPTGPVPPDDQIGPTGPEDGSGSGDGSEVEEPPRVAMIFPVNCGLIDEKTGARISYGPGRAMVEDRHKDHQYLKDCGAVLADD